MAIFRPNRHYRQNFPAESRGQGFVRAVLICLLAAGVFFSVSHTTSRMQPRTGPDTMQTQKLTPNSTKTRPDSALPAGSPLPSDFPAPIDLTQTLSPEQEQELLAYVRAFEKTYGLSLRIQIRATPFSKQEQAELAQTLDMVLALCPQRQQVLFLVPPLAHKILGEPLIKDLREAHFIPYFKDGNWPVGLAGALNKITRKLDEP